MAGSLLDMVVYSICSEEDLVAPIFLMIWSLWSPGCGVMGKQNAKQL